MIGPLDAGTYQLMMYYIAGAGSPSPFQLCSNSLVDLRLISKATYANKTEEWMCTSSRVPLPDTLSPQRDEQILVDSEYLVPPQGRQSITFKVPLQEVTAQPVLGIPAEFDLKDGGSLEVSHGECKVLRDFSDCLHSHRLEDLSELGNPARDWRKELWNASFIFHSEIMLHMSQESSSEGCFMPWKKDEQDH
ncbi:Top3a [Symbiodinium sp. CCMP2592]|nr:Top3a [Symbiodinium sp. CCMP2592]